jgi:6-phosphogluconolactonase
MNPSWVAEHPKRPFLFAVGETSSYNGRTSGSVSAFRIDESSGQLTLINQCASEGTAPCHLSCEASGKFVMVANYGSGTVAAFPIGEDGTLGPTAAVVQHEGSSINPERQKGPHAHFIAADHENRYALACDLGLDKILVYSLGGRKALQLEPSLALSLRPGAGPRHVSFHPDRRRLYVVNELDSTVTSLGYGPRGQLHLLGTVSTLPAGFSKPNSCAEVEVHPSGKFVYASNRGHNTIAAFGTEPQTGGLISIQHQDTGGRTPRHFALDKSGKWLLVANQDSDNIVVLRVDAANGRLAPTGQSVTIGAPVCLAWSRY